MKKFKSLLCLGIVSSLIVTSTCVFANSSGEVNSKAMVNENIVRLNSDYGIIPYDTSYAYSNFPVNDQASFYTSITLSSKYNYGKAYYTNNSNSKVTMRVYGKGFDKTETIDPDSGKGLPFTRSGMGNQEYKVDIKCSTENLNGIFSLGMSDSKLN